jgi:hypothetical protein
LGASALAGARNGGCQIIKPKQLQPLTSVDAAYIAGLIDGEGTITLTRKHKQENGYLKKQYWL